MMKIVSLHTEYLENPMGIDAVTPWLGWKIESDRTGVMQSAQTLLHERQSSLGASYPNSRKQIQ